MSDESRAEARLWAWAVGLAAILGVGLRLKAFVADRSLWLDEAMLALNICGRSFEGLWTSLDYDQAAPIGFLMAERLAVVLFGPTELALRLVPFLASIATLGLVFWFCRANYGMMAAFIGVALTSVTPGLISYSGEAKQYSVDVAAGLLVLTLGADALRLGLSRRRAVVLAVVGAVVVWFSHPVALVLAGVGTTLILQAMIGRLPARTRLAIGASLCWMASFLLIYVSSLRVIQSNSNLNSFWESAFLNFPPTSVQDLRQYVIIIFGIFEAAFQNTHVNESLSPRMGVIAAAAWLTGVVMLWRRGEREIATLLTAPLAFGLLAAFLHKYPLRFRLALFTAGPVLLGGTVGLVLLLRSVDGSCRAVGRVLIVCLFAFPTMQAAQYLLGPERPHGARTVLEGVAREWQTGDLVLVDSCSEPAFRWYQKYAHIDGLDRLSPTVCKQALDDPARLVSILPSLQGRSRVWMLVSSHMPDPGGRDAELRRLTLDHWGEHRRTVGGNGYLAYLYDFNSPQITLAGRPSKIRK